MSTLQSQILLYYDYGQGDQQTHVVFCPRKLAQQLRTYGSQNPNQHTVLEEKIERFTNRANGFYTGLGNHPNAGWFLTTLRAVYETPTTTTPWPRRSGRFTVEFKDRERTIRIQKLSNHHYETILIHRDKDGAIDPDRTVILLQLTDRRAQYFDSIGGSTGETTTVPPVNYNNYDKKRILGDGTYSDDSLTNDQYHPMDPDEGANTGFSYGVWLASFAVTIKGSDLQYSKPENTINYSQGIRGPYHAMLDQGMMKMWFDNDGLPQAFTHNYSINQQYTEEFLSRYLIDQTRSQSPSVPISLSVRYNRPLTIRYTSGTLREIIDWRDNERQEKRIDETSTSLVISNQYTDGNGNTTRAYVGSSDYLLQSPLSYFDYRGDVQEDVDERCAAWRDWHSWSVQDIDTFAGFWDLSISTLHQGLLYADFGYGPITKRYWGEPQTHPYQIENFCEPSPVYMPPKSFSSEDALASSGNTPLTPNNITALPMSVLKQVLDKLPQQMIRHGKATKLASSPNTEAFIKHGDVCQFVPIAAIVATQTATTGTSGAYTSGEEHHAINRAINISGTRIESGSVRGCTAIWDFGTGMWQIVSVNQNVCGTAKIFRKNGVGTYVVDYWGMPQPVETLGTSGTLITTTHACTGSGSDDRMGYAIVKDGTEDTTDTVFEVIHWCPTDDGTAPETPPTPDTEKQEDDDIWVDYVYGDPGEIEAVKVYRTTTSGSMLHFDQH
jgi:hypothetical protein